MVMNGEAMQRKPNANAKKTLDEQYVFDMQITAPFFFYSDFVQKIYFEVCRNVCKMIA
jgi:hypothetical protein